jgi:OPA family glycerol-3-phosphate transporter-like MFS transporter/OPA family sugar phosphate sensor protein UhpC-like MFS transporter
MDGISTRNDTKRKYSYWQNRVLIGAIVGYVTFYIVRKNYSFAVPALKEEFGYTNAQLGSIMTFHSMIYGLSKFLSGFAADKLSSRHMLVCALLLCSLCNIFFGLSSSILMLTIFWVLNGVFQGAGFPPIAHLFAYWFPTKQLASKMSIWQSSHSIGACLASIISGYIVTSSLGWRSCFYIPAMLTLIGVIWMWISIRDYPSDVGLPEIDELENNGQQIKFTSKEEDESEYKQLLIKKVFKNKVIWALALSNFGVYALRLMFLDWGPSLLNKWKGIPLEHAGWVVAFFELAGILGTLTAGHATDRFFKGKAQRVCLICHVSALFFAFLFWRLRNIPPILYIILLIFTGFFVYGAQSLVTTAVSKTATRKVAATACGFQGFCGYLSTVVTGTGFGKLTDLFGWSFSIGFVLIVAAPTVVLLSLIWNAKADGYDDNTLQPIENK